MKYLLPCLIFVLIACQSTDKSASNTAAAPPKETVTKPKISEEKTSALPEIERWTASEYRNENWHPEKGQYFFSETWIWEFVNENLPKEDPHHQGEFWVYVDPPTGTLLLRREDANYLSEMTDWILIHPDGRWVQQWTDHDGTKQQETHQMSDFVTANDFEFQPEDFKQFFKKTGEFKIFGTNKYGWETFHGAEWEQSYAKTNDIATVYMTFLPFDVRPLYLVEKINGDLRLPIPFSGYAYLLPKGYLLLQEMASFNGKKVGFRFKSASPTKYFLNTEL